MLVLNWDFHIFIIANKFIQELLPLQHIYNLFSYVFSRVIIILIVGNCIVLKSRATVSLFHKFDVTD